MDSQQVVYSDQVPHGIRLVVNGVLVIGTKKNSMHQAV